MTYILVVDDDPDVRETIRSILDRAGYQVRTASDGQEALDLISRQTPSAVILDIIMPEMDGMEVCRQIRADPFVGKIPILFLTAKGRPEDIVRGLDVGGDDYLTKPFEIIEIPARIRALLRRGPSGALDPGSEHLVIGPLKIHANRPEVWVGDILVELRPAEHRLLYYLMMHAGNPTATQRLLEDVWGYPSGTGDPSLVYVHIANIRSKFEEIGAPPPIRSIRGHGYMIDV
jgi:two-component system OmpR family response regulator